MGVKAARKVQVKEAHRVRSAGAKPRVIGGGEIRAITGKIGK